MSDMSDKAEKITNNVYGRSVIPFTGPGFAIWAFFAPESFGTWFGTILHSLRVAGGF